jgi:hypothetical protein
MNSLETLQQHHKVCDELYDLALEENRFLRQYRRTPGSDLLERKRSLYERLTAALDALRGIPAGGSRPPAWRGVLDKARSRILQILQLDKENEQLLLRYSLSRGEPAPAPMGAPAGMLEKIYGRSSAA